jgi:RNA polymerase sigma-70 factor (ECF subfamily)
MNDPGFDAAQAAGAVKTLEEIPADIFGDEVAAALRELPEEMAVAVYLADVEQLSYAEISDILDVPAGTVKSRIARGRRHLQNRLVEYAREYRIAGSESP